MLKHTKHLFITTFHNVREIHSTNIVKKQSQFQEYHNTQVWDVQPTDFRRQMFPKLGKVHSTNPFEKDSHECDSQEHRCTKQAGLGYPILKPS